MGQYNMFTDLKEARDVSAYTLFRGTTDFTQLQQFDLYETGYPLLVLVSIPEFLTKMAEKDTEVERLVRSYRHILEYEFRGFNNGIDDITSDQTPISNGVQEINVITKVNGPGATNFSMNFWERSGSTITKMHELYLRSVRDPATTYKHYNGLIGFDSDQINPQDAGYHKECFSFMYMETDNTGLLLERAAYIIGAQPTTATTSIYNTTKGDVGFSEISVEYSGFPLFGSKINAKAKDLLDWINSSSNELMMHRNSWDYDYAAINDSVSGLAQTSLTAN